MPGFSDGLVSGCAIACASFAGRGARCLSHGAWLMMSAGEMVGMSTLRDQRQLEERLIDDGRWTIDLG